MKSTDMFARTDAWRGGVLVVEMHGLVTRQALMQMRAALWAQRPLGAVVVRMDLAVLLIDNATALRAAKCSRRSLPGPVAWVCPEHVFDGYRMAAAKAASKGLVRGAFCAFEPALAWAQEMAGLQQRLAAC